MKLEEFLEYLRIERNRSPHTVTAYANDLRQFALWAGLEADSLCSPGTVTAGHIRAWLADMADAGIEAASLRRKTQSLRAFFHWAMRMGFLSSDPTSDVALAKLPKHLPSVVRPDEMERTLSEMAAHADDYRSFRNLLAVEILFSLGLRKSELLQLTDRDIREDEIRIHGKGDKERVLPLPPALRQRIKTLQRLRDENYPDLPAPRPLIASSKGAISAQTLHVIVREALAQSAAERKSPHTLRHSFATAMLNDGANLDAVRQLLGHVSLSTTQIYTHLTPAQLRQAYQAAHPRAQKK